MESAIDIGTLLSDYSVVLEAATVSGHIYEMLSRYCPTCFMRAGC